MGAGALTQMMNLHMPLNTCHKVVVQLTGIPFSHKGIAAHRAPVGF